MRNRVFFDEGSLLNMMTTHELRFLKTMMWYPTHFDDILNKMKGLQEPAVQTSTGGSCMCNQPQQEKGTFQRHEIYKDDSAQK